MACVVLLDVNAAYSGPCHHTIYRGFEVLVTYSEHINICPPHTVAKFPGVYARLKSVLCEGGWLVSSLKLVVLRIRRCRDSVAVLKV